MLPEPACQPRRTSGAPNAAERPRDPDVRRERDLQPAAQAVAADGRHDGLAQAQQRPDVVAVVDRAIARLPRGAEVVEQADVAAGAEAPARRSR